MSETDMPNKYSVEFNNIKFGNLPLADVRLGKGNLYTVALSILAEVERLQQSKNVRDKMLLAGYNCLVGERGNVNLVNVCKTLVKLGDDYRNERYSYRTIFQNWFTQLPPKPVYDDQGNMVSAKLPVDNYQLSFKEFHTTHGDATFKQLVKALRFFGQESVTSCFPRNLDTSEWFSKDCTFRGPEGKRITNEYYQMFVQTLLDCMTSLGDLSDELSEITTVVKAATEKGKLEGAERRKEAAERKSQQFEKKVVNKSYPKRQGEQPEKTNEPKEQPKKRGPLPPSPPRKPVVNKWAKGNPVVADSDPTLLQDKYKLLTEELDALDKQADEEEAEVTTSQVTEKPASKKTQEEKYEPKQVIRVTRKKETPVQKTGSKTKKSNN